jgi:predicted short-subunit dehydrogenase-like oxidoreductase (DUF2520 family)
MIQQLAKEIADGALAAGFVEAALRMDWDASQYQLMDGDWELVKDAFADLDDVDFNEALGEVEDEVRRLLAEACGVEA